MQFLKLMLNLLILHKGHYPYLSLVLFKIMLAMHNEDIAKEQLRGPDRKDPAPPNI